MTNHAVLSASASHRWLNCPPSVRLTESIPDNGSIYAAEGSEAHELCEYKLRQLLGMEAHNPLDTPIGLRYYDGTMEDAATGYAAFVLELLEEIRKTCSDPIVMVEQKLDYSRWVQDLSDTVRLCAAGSAGQHRPAEPEDHAVVLLRVWSDSRDPCPHHCGRRRFGRYLLRRSHGEAAERRVEQRCLMSERPGA